MSQPTAQLQGEAIGVLGILVDTPWKINMEPGNDGFQIGISFSKGPFSGSMFVLGSVCWMFFFLSVSG